MKAIKLTLIALTFSILLPLSMAHAAPTFFSSYAEFYTVGSVGSTTPQLTFAYDQTPVLYVELYPTTPTNTNLVNRLDIFDLVSPSNNNYVVTDKTHTNQFWFTNSAWKNIESMGAWTVDGLSVGANNPLSVPSIGGKTNFNVTCAIAPEPSGTILFMIGAAILGLFTIRRRKDLATVSVRK